MCPCDAKIPSACCLRMWSRKTDPNSGRLLCCQVFLAMSSFHFNPRRVVWHLDLSLHCSLPPSLSESSERPLPTEQLGVRQFVLRPLACNTPMCLGCEHTALTHPGDPLPMCSSNDALNVFSSPLEPRWLAFTSFSSASLSAGFSS